MAEYNSVSHARRGSVTRDQWFAEVLRLAQEAGYVADSEEDSLEDSIRFAGDSPFIPSRVPGGSASNPLGPAPLWDHLYAAELSPVEAVEGALAAVEFDEAAAAEADREAADADDVPADEDEPSDEDEPEDEVVA